MAGHRSRHVPIAALALSAVMGVGLAVRAQDAQQPAPTFRSEINYVQLPVRVLDRRGEFVGGLTQADFRVLEDGAPQTITAFSAVDIPFIPADDFVPAATIAAVDPVASNESAHVDGRVYLFVLDDRHTEAADSPLVRRLVQRFISDRLGANDVAGIVMTGGARGQEFTRNRTLLAEAVGRFVGDGGRGDTPVFDDAQRRQVVLSTIADLAEWMGSIKGRRKALVLVTPSGICSLDGDCAEPLRHALRMAMQSDVSIYTIDPRGTFLARGSRAENARFDPSQEAPRGALDGARYLAEESGGFATINTNNFDGGFERIVRENSSYYLIGYYSTNGLADGTLRKNDVRVSRRDVRVIHRGSYHAPRLSEARPAGGAGVFEQIRELAASPVPVSAMALRIAAAPFLAANGLSRVAVIVEMPSDTIKANEDDGRYRVNIGLSIGFYDREGRSVGGDDPNIDLALPLRAGPKVTANGIRMVSRIEVPPGTYRLWVGAVQTPSGVRGSVMTEIDVPAFDRQPLALSGIVVTSSLAGRMYTARTDELLDQILGAPPSAGREFTTDSDLWIYGEIYDRRSDGGDVTASVTVRTSDERVVYETAFEPAPVQFGHLARVPLKELGAGAFVATIEVRSAAPASLSTTRVVPFRVR